MRVDGHAFYLCFVDVKNLHLYKTNDLVQINNDFTDTRNLNFEMHIFLLFIQCVKQIIASLKVDFGSTFVPFAIDHHTNVDFCKRISIHSDINLPKWRFFLVD